MIYSLPPNKKCCFYFVVSNKICTFAAKSKYMEKELFRAIIAENQEYIGRIPLIQRPLDLEEYGNYVFVGVRQAGKSYLLYQRMQQLLANGVDIENIVYVNFLSPAPHRKTTRVYMPR